MNTVLAFDLGTTHLKWIVADSISGRPLWEDETTMPTTAANSRSEQDPMQVSALVERVIEQCAPYGRLERVSFSAAMHSVLAVDLKGRPLSACLTWMDKRGASWAREFPPQDARRLRTQTGVPIHPMSPWVKWLALRSSLPTGAIPVSLKDFVIHQLTGQWYTDYSTAAASGFMAVTNHWLPEALEYAHVDELQLPTLRDMTWCVPAESRAFEVMIGGNDAASAHVHLSIPTDGGVGAIAMGTSGALRTTVSRPLDHPELFCFSLGPNRGYLTGAAYSNIGNALGWLARLFSCSFDDVLSNGLDASYHSHLPLCLPYWFGERSPWWKDDVTGGWTEVSSRHTRNDLLGSAWLSIAASFARGLDTLTASVGPLTEVRGGSGLLSHPTLAQWLADALDIDLVIVPDDASLRGALDLALGGPAAHPAIHRYQPRDPAMAQRVRGVGKRLDETMTRLSP